MIRGDRPAIEKQIGELVYQSVEDHFAIQMGIEEARCHAAALAARVATLVARRLVQEKVRVTPEPTKEMIDAGVLVWSEWVDSDEDHRFLVKEIFLAMKAQETFRLDQTSN